MDFDLGELKAVIETPVVPVQGEQMFAVRDGYSLQPRQREGRRSHTFHDLGSFAAWLNRYVAAGDEASAEILAGLAAVQAALKPTLALAEVLTCQLRWHPQFEPWRAIFGKPQDQKQIHAFVRGNMDAFGPGVSGAFLAGELRKLNLVKSDKLNAELDEKGYYQFNETAGRMDLQGKIPPQFDIIVPLIMGVKAAMQPAAPSAEDAAVALPATEIAYTLPILLSMEPDKGIFKLDCPSLPLIEHQARMDAVAYLRSLLRPEFLVGLGEIKVADVAV